MFLRFPASLSRSSTRLHSSLAMEDSRNSVKLMNTLRIHVENRSKDVEFCEKTFNEISKKSPAAYQALLQIYSHNRRLRDAGRFLTKMDPKTTVAYNIVIQLCAKLKKVDEAEMYFAEMQREGLKPCSVTYASMMNVYVQTKQPQAAIELFEDMLQQSINPTNSVMVSCMTGIARSGDFETTQKFFNRLEDFDLKKTEKLYNILMTACIQKMNYEKAREVYTSLRGDGIQPSTTTMNILINSARYDLDLCEKILLEFKTEFGIEKDVQTYAGLFDSCLQTDRLDRAKEFLNEMRDSGIQPNYSCEQRLRELELFEKE